MFRTQYLKYEKLRKKDIKMSKKMSIKMSIKKDTKINMQIHKCISSMLVNVDV